MTGTGKSVRVSSHVRHTRSGRTTRVRAYTQRRAGADGPAQPRDNDDRTRRSAMIGMGGAAGAAGLSLATGHLVALAFALVGVVGFTGVWIAERRRQRREANYTEADWAEHDRKQLKRQYGSQRRDRERDQELRQFSGRMYDREQRLRAWWRRVRS